MGKQRHVPIVLIAGHAGCLLCKYVTGSSPSRKCSRCTSCLSSRYLLRPSLFMNCFEFNSCEGSRLSPFRRKEGLFCEPMKLEIETFGARLLEDVLMQFQHILQSRVWNLERSRFMSLWRIKICCFMVSPNMPALTSGKVSFTFFSF